MNLFYQPNIPEGKLLLDPEESRHCVKVLRKRSGDEIRVTDGRGSFYRAVITTADPAQCTFSLLSVEAELPRTYSVHIAISPTKNADRIEWFVEKCVEIGIDRITLMECEHTERSFIRKDRLDKVAVSAMKQSLKARLPIISEIKSFADVLQGEEHSKFIAYVDAENPATLHSVASPGTSCIVLIGPEGDFSTEELQMAIDRGFKKVSLGHSRLRTETAGMVACHILQLINAPK